LVGKTGVTVVDGIKVMVEVEFRVLVGIGAIVPVGKAVGVLVRVGVKMDVTVGTGGIVTVRVGVEDRL